VRTHLQRSCIRAAGAGRTLPLRLPEQGCRLDSADRWVTMTGASD